MESDPLNRLRTQVTHLYNKVYQYTRMLESIKTANRLLQSDVGDAGFTTDMKDTITETLLEAAKSLNIAVSPPEIQKKKTNRPLTLKKN